MVVVHLGRERRALLLEVGNQLAQRRRIEHGARQHVRAGLARLLEHRNRERLAALRLLQLRQPQRRRHAGRPAADDQDVDFEGFAFKTAPAASSSQSFGQLAVANRYAESYLFSSAIIAGTISNRSPTMP